MLLCKKRGKTLFSSRDNEADKIKNPGRESMRENLHSVIRIMFTLQLAEFRHRPQFRRAPLRVETIATASGTSQVYAIGGEDAQEFLLVRIVSCT